MSVKELPSRPNLEQYRKQAKELTAQCADNVAEALARMRRSHSRPEQAAFRLADAQFVIAREHGFASWPKFVEHLAIAKKVDAILCDGKALEPQIAMPTGALGVVLFAHASGSDRWHPRNRWVVEALHRGALATVHIDLLTEDEELADPHGDLAFDLGLLSRRMVAVTNWLGRDARFRNLGLGYLASETGAAAAVRAAAEYPERVRAVVSSGGRPDLAGPWIGRVEAPTLLIVGGKDTVATGFTQPLIALRSQRLVRKLEIIEGAGQRFEEPDALALSADLARDWFVQHLVSR